MVSCWVIPNFENIVTDLELMLGLLLVAVLSAYLAGVLSMEGVYGLKGCWPVLLLCSISSCLSSRLLV